MMSRRTSFPVMCMGYLPVVAVLFWLSGGMRCYGKEIIFDFLSTPAGTVPGGWRMENGGYSATPGHWEVVIDQVPSLSGSAIADLNVQKFVQAPVLAQTARVTENEHFPMLLYRDGLCRDFTFTLKFKLVAGNVDQMAGIVFRYIDSKNYYVIRASGKDGTLRFYKYFTGLRGDPIGPKVTIPGGVWVDLKVKAEGPVFQAWINDIQVFDKPVEDHSFDKGLVGLWTKSDAVSHFASLKMDFRPLESMAEQLIGLTRSKFPDLEEVTLYARRTPEDPIEVVASSQPHTIGLEATDIEKDVIENKHTYRSRNTSRVMTVTVPLEDRNGDAIAAVRVVYKGFRGESETTSLLKGFRVARYMSENMGSASLFDR